MEKDFDILCNEYMDKIVTVINESNMPLTITSHVLQELLNEVNSALHSKIRNYKKAEVNKNEGDKDENL